MASSINVSFIREILSCKPLKTYLLPTRSCKRAVKKQVHYILLNMIIAQYTIEMRLDREIPTAEHHLSIAQGASAFAYNLHRRYIG